MYKVLCYFHMQTVHLIQTTKPVLVLINLRKRASHLRSSILLSEMKDMEKLDI